jgi:hypothetical protein
MNIDLMLILAISKYFYMSSLLIFLVEWKEKLPRSSELEIRELCLDTLVMRLMI